MEPVMPGVQSELEFNEAIDVALTFFLFAVIIGAVLKWVYSFFKKPLPLAIAIFVVGGLLALIADRGSHGGLINESLKMAETIHPNLIFFILLPPLLFEAASLTDWPVFRRVFAQSIWLAAPGALISTAFMGIFVYIIFNYIIVDAQWTLAECLMFCSMFAATDTVAVVTTLDSLGVPNRVSAPIVGESLLNDASAIVLFQIFKGLVTGAFSPTFGAILGKFLQLALGGVAWGYTCALVVSTMISYVNSDSAVEITILFSGSYVAYFVADVQLHVSGVLAVIVYGLFMSAKGMYVVSPDVAKFEESFKCQVAFFCNTLMFFLGGVISFHRVMYMPEITGDWANWASMLALFAVLLAARVVMVAALWPILTRTGYCMQLAEGKILIWAGLRGAMTIALALAMDLDQTIPKSTKDLMIFHLAGLTCLSLVVNGATVDKFYLYLDIHPPNPYRSVMFDKAMAEIECTHMPEIITDLQDDPFFASVDWVAVRQLVLDMTKAKIDGRSRPEFPDDDGLDAYATFTAMLDRRQKRGLKTSGATARSDDSHGMDTAGGGTAQESMRMSSATMTFGYLKRFEQHQARKQRQDQDEIQLIVSPRGRKWKNNQSRTASTLEPQPIDALFADHRLLETAIDIDLNISDCDNDVDDHHDGDDDVKGTEPGGAHHPPPSSEERERPEPKHQLQNLRDWALALKLKQRIGRRRELIGEDERNAQIVLTLFAALKADFREQFESHHVSHEAVWMLFDAANDGCDACDAKRPTLAMPFRAEWSSLSVRLENNLISPILRNGQKFKLMRALGNWILLQNTFVSLEVLHAFIESHITVVEKVTKEVLVDPTAINKILRSVVEKAEALLCDHGQAMPAFFSVVVTVLAARRLLHWKRQKLLSLSQEGVVNQKDMVGLISAIDARLQMLSATTTLFRISQIRALDRERSKLMGAAGAVFAHRSRELIKKKIARVMKKTKLRRDVESYREVEGESCIDNFEHNVMTRVADTVAANHKTVRYDEKSFEEIMDYGSDYSL